MHRATLSLAATFALLWATIAPAVAAKRVALVIGNTAYTSAPPLQNAANDARAVSDTLTKLGFEVHTGIDRTKVETDDVLRAFASALEDADAAIFYYAGHGLQVGGQNYLVPIDAKLVKERDLEFEAVRVDFILKQMELGRENKTNIVFLDACRDNPLARSLARTMGTRSANIGKGLAQVDAGVGTFIAYSTQPGNVALDGEGANSPFTAALVKHMTASSRALTSIMVDVRKDVIAATNGQQVPWDHSALTGEFYFDPNAKPGDDPTALQTRVRELEQDLSTKAKSASTAALTQLRQRVKQMEDENRRDWQRVHKLSRDKMSLTDARQMGEAAREIGEVQIGIVRRGRDINELKQEITRLETDLGLNAAAEKQD